MPKKTKVLTGARSQENYPDRADPNAEENVVHIPLPSRIPTAEEIEEVHRLRAGREAKTNGAKIRIFQSRYHYHRLQMETAPDTILNGRVIPGKNRAIMFRDGVYQTSDPEILAFLTSHAAFNVDFWDLDQLKTEAAVKRYEDFIDAVKTTPELMDRLRQALGKDDFDPLERLAKKVQEKKSDAETVIPN